MNRFTDLNRQAIPRLGEIVSDLLPGGTVKGREYRCADITGGNGQSCSVNLTTGRWADFATDERGGDVISLVAASQNVSQGEAAQSISLWLGREWNPTISRKRLNKQAALSIFGANSSRKPHATPTTPLRISHPELGSPTATWAYRDDQGGLIGFACRFDKPDGKKVLPYTYGPDGWQWKNWTEPRPLFGLDRLADFPDLPVLLVEGEKTAEAAQRLLPSWVVVTWSGGCQAAEKSDFSRLKNRKVFIWPDADDPGRKVAARIVNILGEIAPETKFVEPPPGVTSGWDLADALLEGWSSERVESWIENHQEGSPTRNDLEQAVDWFGQAISTCGAGQLSFSSADDLCAQSTNTIPWLIKGLLTQECLALLFGPSSSMKTFVLLDWLLSIASPRKYECMGHPIKAHGPVFYLCGEGHSGLGRRVKAWCLANKIDPSEVQFFASNHAVAMLDRESVAEMQSVIDNLASTHGRPFVIALDTLNRCFGPGDENSTSDMTAFISAVDSVKARYGCAIVIAHHSGLVDDSRSRGSSALRGALDLEYRLKVVGDNRLLECTKAKDIEPPEPIYISPVTIDLGIVDEDLRPITSLVLTKLSGQPQTSRKLTANCKLGIESLKHLDGGSPIGLEDWRQEFYARHTGDNQEAKRKAFERARKELVKGKYIQCRDDQYWIHDA